MSDRDRDKWNHRYLTPGTHAGEVAFILSANLHLLPATGKALDLACGTGANALLLASAALEVHAWDISDIALGLLQQQATRVGFSITTRQCDILIDPPSPESFDVIVVSRFLERTIFPSIINALKPGGLIYYQTWTRTKANDVGPSNPDYLLEHNELLALFSQLAIVVYREDGITGNRAMGLRNEAMIVAQKR